MKYSYSGIKFYISENLFYDLREMKLTLICLILNFPIESQEEAD